MSNQSFQLPDPTNRASEGPVPLASPDQANTASLVKPGAETAHPSRRVRRGRIQTRLTALILFSTVPLLIGIAAFISLRAGNEIEAQANLALQNNQQALETNVSTWLGLHVRTVHEMALLPDIVSMDAERQRPNLLAIAAAHPNLFLVQTTDLNGINIARNDEQDLKDYHDRAWFLGAQSGAPITYEVLISRTTNNPALNLSTPITNGSGQIIGVASIVSELNEISQEVLNIEEGHGITFIVDVNNQVVAHPDPAYTDGELRDMSEYPPVVALRQGQTGLISFTDEYGERWRAYVDTLDNGWGIIAQQPEAEILAPVRQFQGIAFAAILAGATVMLALAWFFIQRTLRPIDILTSAVSAIAAGDLDRRVEVNSRDELGILASAINDMTTQLRGLVGRLEQRVAATTRNLTLASEVGRSVLQEHALDVLLKQAAERILDSFGLYHTQVYLLDPAGRQLVLRAGTGAVGQQLISRRHSLTADLASLNGTAVVERRAVIVEDTQTSTIHRPNPLLPETRSEMVVPLMIGERVVGTLDMQSSQTGILTLENLPAFEALAGQLAIAIENAALLTETEAARAQVEAHSRRLARSGWEDFLNAVERGERIGYAYDQEDVTPYTDPISISTAGQENALVVPIPVSNEPVGVFKFEGVDAWSKADTELVDMVARQLGQQVENLRLLAQANRYRTEAEEALRRLTHEGWKAQLATHAGTELGFTYDTNTITPLSASGENGDSAITRVLEIMGVKIGELAVAGPDGTHEEVDEILTAVSEQLATRVENLRLFEETERNQVELNRRARQLAAVAEISTASSRELDVETMLASVVQLTQRKFGLYHVHIFLYEEGSQELRITSCGWQEGDPREGTHETGSISLAKEMSLVARAGRDRQAVIVNNVRYEPKWLPNPQLPDTAAEMAIPLLIGDQLLGVLDLQSDRVNAFSEEDANIQMTLASQVATALQNARSFLRAQQQADREKVLNIIGQKIQNATSVEAVLQIAARELGHALGAPLTIAQLSVKDK